MEEMEFICSTGGIRIDKYIEMLFKDEYIKKPIIVISFADTALLELICIAKTSFFIRTSILN